MSHKISVNVHLLEVEKPSGGGRGPRVPYSIDVVIDGEAALFLTSNNFKKPGQMQAFIDFIESLP